ncbi:MAG: PrsW family glutamic-type intramembrane protease [Bacteroidales bacterium]|nr:PrsW family glutamic-type intramembrane protease [Bacteroidales bacterium]
MFINALILSLAPIVLILLYIYLRDKYEKEPLRFCLFLTSMGMLSVIPVIIVEFNLMLINNSIRDPILSSFWEAFVVAGFTEELFKFLVLILFAFQSKHFNEPMDGIVYAVFVSLGFALVENVFYVFQDVNEYLTTGVVRAFTTVPAHAFFAIIMGFYLAKKKFYQKSLFPALLLPFIAHGIYDFILFASFGEESLLIFFPFYLTFLLIVSMRLIRKAILDSPFKN